MPTFSYDHTLPSVKLTKDLVAALERYLTVRVVEACGATEDDVKPKLSFAINDGLGVEKFASVDEFHPSRFPDTTTQVSVQIESPWRTDTPRVTVRLQFSPVRLFSSAAMTVTATNPREIAVGLQEGISRILEPHRTWHWFCHPNAEVWGACITAFLALAVALWQLDSKHPAFPFALAGALLLCLYFLQYAHKIRPYTVFDSRAAERAGKIWSWVMGGLLSFLLFGTLLTFLRRGFLGF